MMFLPPPLPPCPLSPWATNKDREQYARDLARWRALKAEHTKALKEREATMIVVCGLSCTAAVSGVLTGLYFEFGINGPLGGLVAGGLFVLAVKEVERWL